MKKILVCTGYFYPHLGGHERYVEELFARLPVDLYQIHVFTVRTGPEPYREVYRGLTIHRVDSWNLLGGTYPIPIPNRRFWSTVQALRAEGFMLINTHTRFFPMSALGAWLARRWGIRHVHTEHGTVHPRGSMIVRVVGWMYDHTIGWLVIRSATNLIGISQASVAFSRHLGGRDAVVVPNGVDTNFFQPATKTSTSTWRLVFVGRLIPAKGLYDLFAALSWLTTADWVLDVIGSGPAQAKLQQTVADKRNIIFHGALPPDRIRPFLQHADLFVNPSYAEGLPTSVLEAASCGCAVVATDVGGTAEIFNRSTNDWLVQPGDVVALRQKLQTILNDPELRERLGRENRQQVIERYSWTVIAQQFQSWLEKTMIPADQSTIGLTQ